MAKKRTQSQSEALAILNARSADFKRKPSPRAWAELSIAMRLYQAAYQNPDAALMTVPTACSDLRKSGNL